MFSWFQKPKRIHGVIIPSRRFTVFAAIYFILFGALPILTLTLLLDFIGWILTVKLFGADCYGVFCLFN